MIPKRGLEKVIGLFTDNLREVYEDLDAAVEGADLLVTHLLPLVGPIVAQKRGLPWVSTVLAPISFFSAYDPPVPPQMPALYHVVKLSPILGRLFQSHCVTQGGESYGACVPVASRTWSATRKATLTRRTTFAAVGVGPILFHIWTAATRLACEYAFTGFAFYDRRDYFGETEMETELLRFLDNGPPPIIFTLGSSAFWVAENFYSDSIGAAQSLGRRALLLIGHQRNLPEDPLPEGIAAFEYAPFAQVFPRAAAVVHSGGVGTTGQALRAGRPQLVVPHAHDQFDNASRVVRLGCGRSVARPRYNAKSATRELRALLDTSEYATKASEVGQQVQREDGARVAADAIEEMLTKAKTPELEYAAGY